MRWDQTIFATPTFNIMHDVSTATMEKGGSNTRLVFLPIDDADGCDQIPN